MAVATTIPVIGRSRRGQWRRVAITAAGEQDDKDDQHGDRANVDQQLRKTQELSAKVEVKRPDSGKRNRQRQRAMHQAAEQHRGARANQGHCCKNQKRSAHQPHSAKR
jgi:hypothetical protein